ncbi:MAG: hypothetical protein HUJ54_14250, partial [Erysipelotrichaceae bacterium]|nr:hypothetical protein [Erysipelotrichaceae bacterium]
MYIKAGEMVPTDFAPMENFASVTEIRVVPTKEYDKLILPRFSGHLFWGFSSVTKIDTARFDTSRTEKMDGMFGSCSSLESIDLSGFDT